MKRLMKKLNAKESPPSKFILKCINSHNKYRAIHGSPELSYSQELTNYAQEWADSLAERSVFERRPNWKYGENLFTAFETNPKWFVQPSDPVKSWYSEIELYTFDDKETTKVTDTGHFTQLIWCSTTKLGVGISLDSSNRVYVVCDYDPRGNTVGQFAENVLPPVKAVKYKNTRKTKSQQHFTRKEFDPFNDLGHHANFIRTNF